MNDHRNIAIFASGAGSNAKTIIEHFTGHPLINVSLIVCNNPMAGVLKHAENYGVPSILIEKERFFKGDGYVEHLKNAEIDFIVLAGFLWKVPDTILAAFSSGIINIHPALLPKYGGKGMYGARVHLAVIDAKDDISGITIHKVDAVYDNGEIVFQATCPVYEHDTADSLAAKIHQLEHAWYPKVIEDYLNR